MKNFRIEQIKKTIEDKKVVRVKDICAMFPDYSVMTIHRDLDFLEKQGIIERVRGGARYIGDNPEVEPTVALRQIENRAEKEELCRKTLGFFAPDKTYFFDSGTTAMLLCKLAPDMPYHVITASPEIAISFSKKRYPPLRCVLASSAAAVCRFPGPRSLLSIENTHIDVSFLVTSGYTLETQFTCGNRNEAQLKALAAHRADTVVLLMDRAKFGREFPHWFLDMTDVDFLVLDDHPHSSISAAAKQAGATVL